MSKHRNPGYLLRIVLLGIALAAAAGCGLASAKGISASGTVESTEIDVNAETGGKIAEVFVDEGTRVKKGDLLAKLDSTVQALQVQQAEAALVAAQENSKATKAGSRQQSVAQAQEAVSQVSSLQAGARVTMNNARENLERTQALYKEGGATSQQLSDARTRYETAKAQYDAYGAQKTAATEQLDLLKSGSTKEVINIADAGVAQARAALSIAKAQLAKTMIYAPISGIVNTLNFKAGEFVAAGAGIVTILNPGDTWVTVYLSEKDLPKVKLGQTADITTDAFPDKKFPGQISYISSKAEFTPKNLQTKEERVNMVFAVKVKVKPANDLLKPGLPVDIVISAQ